MSASLIILIPVVLLGLVTALCFVGCGLSTHGLGEGYGPYHDGIRNTSNLVAFWPLDDQPSPDVSQPEATDIAPKQAPLTPFTGFYTGPAGSFTLGNTGIVTGDVDNGLTPCASFNGGFVNVDFHKELNPAQFTLECWVKPNWTAADAQVPRAVLVSFNSAGAGYSLFANPNNFWQVQIGTGGGNFASATATDGIALSADPSLNPVTYLAATYDGTTLSLFVGVAEASPNVTPSQPTTTSFVPEQSMASPSTATPLFIGMGRPDTPNGMFPFNGFIQDVAIYNTALDPGTIQKHFALGSVPPG